MHSLERLGLEQADLVLLHWPFGNYDKAWRELEEIYDEGKLTRAIGVSNFSAAQIVDLVKFNRIVPAVNQIETSLISQQQECREWMRRYGIAHMGYGPFVRDKMPQLYEDSRLTAMAAKYGKSPRQVTLRFLHQEGVILIPKSVHTERIAENMEHPYDRCRAESGPCRQDSRRDTLKKEWDQKVFCSHSFGLPDPRRLTSAEGGQKSPLTALQSERAEEVVALVIHEDECREVLHADFPDGFHSEFRKLDAFDALDVVLGKNCGRTSD